MISPHVHFTSRSFHTKLISPHIPIIQLRPRNNNYCHTYSILVSQEKPLESNYQSDNQTMLAMSTLKTEHKKFTRRNTFWK